MDQEDLMRFAVQNGSLDKFSILVKAHPYLPLSVALDEAITLGNMEFVRFLVDELDVPLADTMLSTAYAFEQALVVDYISHHRKAMTKRVNGMFIETAVSKRDLARADVLFAGKEQPLDECACSRIMDSAIKTGDVDIVKHVHECMGIPVKLIPGCIGRYPDVFEYIVGKMDKVDPEDLDKVLHTEALEGRVHALHRYLEMFPVLGDDPSPLTRVLSRALERWAACDHDDLTEKDVKAIDKLTSLFVKVEPAHDVRELFFALLESDTTAAAAILERVAPAIPDRTLMTGVMLTLVEKNASAFVALHAAMLTKCRRTGFDQLADEYGRLVMTIARSLRQDEDEDEDAFNRAVRTAYYDMRV